MLICDLCGEAKDCLQREIDGKDMIPHFHFETLPPNLWIVAIINIHAGVNAMKTLWRSVPNG